MKIFFITSFLTFAVLLSAVAQDIITLKSGEELNIKIVKLNPSDIVYIQKGSTDTSTRMREEVLKIHYQNGTLVYLTDNKNQSKIYENDTMYNAGIADANMYYKGYKAATAGTIVAALIFPFNLIPAVACSVTPPSISNLGYRNPKLMENHGYYFGYTKQAHKIKKHKVWSGYAIGSGAVIVLYILLSTVAVTVY
jgi:hypothetical protein